MRNFTLPVHCEKCGAEYELDLGPKGIKSLADLRPPPHCKGARLVTGYRNGLFKK
jgi:hypothetical protein